MLLALFLACSEVVAGLAPPCLPDAPVVEGTTAIVPGATIRLRAHPLSAEYDVSVYVGATAAEVLGVSRDGCDDYDACLEAEACSACGDCDDCGPALLSCVETVRIRVPDLAPAAYPVVIYTRFGQTQPGTLTVAGSDTGTDTGVSE